ncbi:MAG: glycosyltransferase [Actinobacteria bacterium]|nr:glycosyltransferase [Actinomycetota bacterium]
MIWWSFFSQIPQVAPHLLMFLYVVLMGTVVLYGFHRYLLIFLYYRHRHKYPSPSGHFQELPAVTVQLPMYNEEFVAARVIQAACAMDYPRQKLQIQVLDDSTDATAHIASECVRRLSQAGHNICYLHRSDRSGFKAGALAAGLPSATGEFIAIFDADFVPEPDFLLRTIHYFTAPSVGVVQTRWGHLNRDSSLLTKGQAMFLDGHFIIEHGARNRSGRFMAFNGTAGIWRRRCIADAGSWQHDTLTEDLDLSYRAQLKGWKFIYLPQMVSPAELPPQVNAFKVQQFRWTKGAVQTARKLLPSVLRAELPLKVKVEAFFQLTNWVVYPAMVLLTVLLVPALIVRLNPFEGGGAGQILFDLTVFNLATVSLAFFYLCSQQEIYSSWLGKIKYLPFLISLGIGISLNNCRAVLEGLFGKQSDFISTPKFGLSNVPDRSRRVWMSKATSPRRMFTFMPYIELLFGLYIVACIAGTLIRYRQITVSIPFLLLFAAGYFYVSFANFYGLYITDSAGKVQLTEPIHLPPPAQDPPDSYPQPRRETA